MSADVRMMAHSSRSRQFEQFRALIQEHTGIVLPATKEGMIEARLRARISALGCGDVLGYFDHIFQGNGLSAEMPRIIEAITTNKTDFFREADHYAFLRDEIIPSALRRRRAGRAVIKLWSAAASTGAEAWSAAMLLAEARSRSPELEWGILGTGISSRVIQAARRAIYPEAELLPVPPALLDRYTMRGQDSAGAPLRRIAPELRRRANFHEMNLMDRTYPIDRDLDAIFLRNVLIYFDAPTQTRIVANLSRHLRPGGFLVVGHSESMIVRQPDLVQRATGVFERTGSGDGPTTSPGVPRAFQDKVT